MKNKNYIIKSTMKIEHALKAIDCNMLGLVCIEKQKKIVGLVTDGDIRRALLSKHTINTSIVKIMNKDFTYLIDGEDTRENILKLLDTRVKVIPVLSKSKNLIKMMVGNALEIIPDLNFNWDLVFIWI